MASTLAKLRGRSATELLDRARQGATRWLERRGFGDVGEPDPDRLLVTRTSRAIEGPFFASFEDREATLAALARVDAEYSDKLRARADRLLSNEYDLLGHHGLVLQEPIDWWTDPQTGVRAPDLHWSCIDFLDPAVVGDHKLVWELGRHQALVTLAQAGWCTGNRRYADRCAELLGSWLAANPPKRGVHWASSLELSFRSIAWLWILALVGDELPEELRVRVVSHIAIAGRHIERHLSTWFSPNTHLTGEALGLFMIGTALPEIRESKAWQQVGSSILLEWLTRHVRPDGTYVEQSTWYHRYTTDFYLHFLILAERAGLPVRSRVAGPLTGLIEHLMWITRPDGTMPLVGDDDGGRLLFLDERTAHDARTPLALGAALFGRGDFARQAGVPGPELVWLLGPAGLTSLYGLRPELPDATARRFPDGGTCVIRSGWDKEASVMVIDAGSHGFLNAGHAHGDALSIDFTFNGHAVFVDPGTFTYTTSRELRDLFRETAMHNAATVDGCASATPDGPFRWATRAESACNQWQQVDGVVLFSGSHDGFHQLRPRVDYTRYIAYIPPDLWIVREEIEGEGEHELAVHWQCAPGLSCAGGAGSMTLSHGRADVLLFSVLEQARWRFSDGWVSPAYGSRVDVRHITCSTSGVGRARLTTVMCAPDGRPVVKAISVDGRPALLVRHRDVEGMLVFREGREWSWQRSVEQTQS